MEAIEWDAVTDLESDLIEEFGYDAEESEDN